MPFRSWWKSRTIPPTRKVGRKHSRESVLRVEQLEDRLLLSLSPHLLKDINPGAGSSSPAQFVDVGGTTFFVADNGKHGPQLWESNGTAPGTSLVKVINPALPL